jgi:4-hydroxy-2-oxoheptanedioate aldolase
VQIGLWSSLAAISALVVADAGFDWILLDGEHSPNDVPSVMSQVQALNGGTASPIVRPAWNDAVMIKRISSARVTSCAYVQNAERPSAPSSGAIPPAGIRGVAASTRANHYGRVNNYLKLADSEICLLVQVETRSALGQLEAIAKVEGVDGVFIGPSDLAASLGHIGNPAHAEVQTALEDAVKRLKAVGKPAGILTLNEEEARRYIGWGYTFVAVRVRHRAFGTGRGCTGEAVQDPDRDISGS